MINRETYLSKLKSDSKYSFILSIILIIFAVLLLINPDNFINMFINTIGFILIIFGIFSLVSYFRCNEEEKFISSYLTNFVLYTLLGGISFIINSSIKDMVFIIIGIYIIFIGSSLVSDSFKIKTFNNKIFPFLLTFGICNSFIGLVISTNLLGSLFDGYGYIAALIIVSLIMHIISRLIILFIKESKEEIKGEEV